MVEIQNHFQILQSYLDKFEYYQIRTEKFGFEIPTAVLPETYNFKLAIEGTQQDKYLIGISAWAEYMQTIEPDVDVSVINLQYGLNSQPSPMPFLGMAMRDYVAIPIIPHLLNMAGSRWRAIPQSILTTVGVNYLIPPVSESFAIQRIARQNEVPNLNAIIQAAPAFATHVILHVCHVYAYGKLKEGVKI